MNYLSGSNRDNLYGHTMGILGTYTYMTQRYLCPCEQEKNS